MPFTSQSQVVAAQQTRNLRREPNASRPPGQHTRVATGSRNQLFAPRKATALTIQSSCTKPLGRQTFNSFCHSKQACRHRHACTCEEHTHVQLSVACKCGCSCAQRGCLRERGQGSGVRQKSPESHATQHAGVGDRGSAADTCDTGAEQYTVT